MLKNLDWIRKNNSKDLQEETVWARGMGGEWKRGGKEDKESFPRAVVEDKGNNRTNSLKHWKSLSNNPRKLLAFQAEHNKFAKGFAEEKRRADGHAPFTRRATLWVNPWLQLGNIPFVLSLWGHDVEEKGTGTWARKKAEGSVAAAYQGAGRAAPSKRAGAPQARAVGSGC